jgi:hypothetical protein
LISEFLGDPEAIPHDILVAVFKNGLTENGKWPSDEQYEELIEVHYCC